MTKNTKLTFILAIVLSMAIGIGIGGYAATSYGTEDDPLVSLSYLTEILTPEIMANLESQLDLSKEEITQIFTDAVAGQGDVVSDTFHVVTLTSGQTITASVGCEFLLRIGSATASGSASPTLVDTSTSSTLYSGDTIETNHLYMVTIAGNGLTATASNTKVLVRGEYSIN